MSDDSRRSGVRGLLGGADDPARDAVPPGVRIASGYAWRFVGIAIASGIVIWLVMQLKLLVIPLLVAILVTALVWPAFSFMVRHRVPRWLAIVVTLLGTIGIVTGLVWLVVWQVSQQIESVRARVAESVEQLRGFLANGPLQLSGAELDGYLQEALGFLQDQADLLWSGALAVGSTVGHIVTGLLLAIFILITLLADGAGIWRWTVTLFPKRARQAADAAGRNGWATVVNYARTQMFVATIDAVGIGLGAFLLGVPLAIPIAVMVFLGAFVPFVGAIVTGAVAVLIALVYNGPLIAVTMLAVVLLVQQVESHVLQPILMGSAVKVHPLAVVLVVAGGSMIAGIAGALFAVPLAAFVNVVTATISTGAWRSEDQPETDLIWQTVPRTRSRSGSAAEGPGLAADTGTVATADPAGGAADSTGDTAASTRDGTAGPVSAAVSEGTGNGGPGTSPSDGADDGSAGAAADTAGGGMAGSAGADSRPDPDRGETGERETNRKDGE